MAQHAAGSRTGFDAAPDTVFWGLLDTAPDAILCVDAEGRIVIANAQAERLFGYSKDELVGSAIEILVPPWRRAEHERHRAGYHREPRPRPMAAGMQLAGRRKDGTEFPAEISLSALDTGDGVLVSAAVREVTERLAAESERERLEALAERERLELRLEQSERLESLGQLAGGVAHDFNNLLGVILNYAAFVREGLDETDPPDDDPARWDTIRADVDQIVRAAERAADLTRQLLSFARREVVRPQVLDLNKAIEGVEQLLVLSLGEDVELSTSLRRDLWAVRADPGKLEQVLVNLAVNARDAMPEGGTLQIDTENIVADEVYVARHPGMAPGRYARLRVSDTGPGMDEATRKRAFEPFFTTKPSGQGTGLGLATVYGIITQAGGHVHITSEPGVGTTITALLPATDELLAASVAPAMSRVGSGETVLVAEDEAPLREVTCRVLTRAGYRVLSAASGPEALTVARSTGHIDLLLTDVVMPQMAGPQLADVLVAERPGLRVVYMSGYALPVLTARGSLDTGVPLVEKPFSGQALLEQVRNVLDATPSDQGHR